MRKGSHHTAESKAKNGAKHRGKIVSQETRELMSIAHAGERNGFFGKHHDEATIEKNRQAHLGKPAWNKGKPMSEEMKQHLSEVKKGRTVPTEVRKKMSEAHKKNPTRPWLGKEFSEEHKRKLGLTFKGKTHTEEIRLRIAEANYIGGFWYGNVRYGNPPQYCEKWRNVNPRVHAFFNNRCVVCGKERGEKAHVGHHVFYEKEACCMYSDDGVYYTNLNAKDHLVKDYKIGENPNYFVVLCRHCHSATNGGFENRKRWADYFRNLIDTVYGGKCYYTKEEFKELKENG